MNQPQKREGFVSDTPVEPQQTAPAPAPEETPQTTLALDNWPITVKLLHRQLRNAKGDMVKELTFREPTGGDINRYGNPVRVDQNGDVIIDEKKMSMMMSSLSGVLLPMFEQIDPRDWNSCAYRLRGFFLPDPAAW